MKKLMALILVTVLSLCFSSLSFAETRTYNTNYGAMTISFDGTYVSGSYTHQNGSLEGVLDGNVMTGTWHQNNGKGTCIFTFSQDFSRFDARWNYAGETGWRGNWNGTAKEAVSAAAVPESFNRSYSTEYGPMTLTFNGDLVTGSYTHQNGKIKGTMDGTVATGTWTQSNGSGSFIFTFDASYKSFEGKWNYKGESSMRGGWNGKPK